MSGTGQMVEPLAAYVTRMQNSGVPAEMIQAGIRKWYGPEHAKPAVVLLSAFLAEKLEPASWLVDGLIPAGPTIGALIGAYKNGKSLGGLQACFAVASPAADNFLGHPIDHHGPAAFVEYEGTRARLQERAARMAAKYGMDVPVSIVHRPGVKIDTDAGETWLRELCTGMVLCVIGPVAKCAGIKREQEAAEWQALAERLQRVADATRCTIVLVHHTRKPAVDYGPPRKVEDYFNSARGSNAYMGAVDFALGVQRDPESLEGTLYNLQRDGESGRIAYDFDVQSLCVWPSDRPLRQPTAEDRVAQTLAYIEGHPDCTRKDIAAYLERSDDTIRDYLALLGDRVTVTGEGSQTRTYRAS